MGRVYVRGLKRLQRKLKKIAPKMNEEIKDILIQGGSDIVKYARANHRFKSRSGALKRAITQRYKKTRLKHTEKIFIDRRMLSSKDGFNYGWAQHDGTYKGYRRSPISPSATPKSLKSGYGIVADHFLYNAVKKYDKRIKKELRAVTKKIKRAFRR